MMSDYLPGCSELRSLRRSQAEVMVREKTDFYALMPRLMPRFMHQRCSPEPIRLPR